MAPAMDFDLAWARYQELRPVAAGITEGNRCAMVLAMALGTHFYPDAASSEHSFGELRDTFMVNLKGTARNIANSKYQMANRMADGMEGQPFLGKYYIKAEQFARRLKREWGAPGYVVMGPQKDFVARTSGRRGVIYIQDGWDSGEDHVDLWNGLTMAAYDKDPGYARVHLEKSKEAWLWVF